MKGIRLLFRWLAVMTILLLPIHMQAQMSGGEQVTITQVNGSITFKIEHKTMSANEAQNAITAKTPIKLTVSMILRGGWVDLLDRGFQVRFNPSSFSFGIAQQDNATAPFYKTDPPAYIGSHYSLAMKCPVNGAPFIAEASNMYIAAPAWNQNAENSHCPIYDYGLGVDNRSNFNTSGASYRHRGTDADGAYYEIDLFPITLMLKRMENVYVRGVDDAGTYVTDKASDLYATSGTTELNLNNLMTDAVLYWPGSASTTQADWTIAPKAYYGGIIPGGIFIEQAPEVAQFEPCR